MNNKPLILITNDDGVFAPGIKQLTESVKGLGDIVVVAPDKGFSGKSHGVTMDIPIFITKISEEPGLTIYSCTGTPADCVKLAIHQILKVFPTLLISGINHGSNSSTSIVYSGTMASAIEGALNGIPSIGFSLASFERNADFSVAGFFAKMITQRALESNLKPGTCWNVNVPSVELQEIKGIKAGRQASAFWKEDFVKSTHPRGIDYYWLTGYFHNTEPEADDTDEWLLKNNYVSVVPISLDFTAHSEIRNLQEIFSDK